MENKNTEDTKSEVKGFVDGMVITECKEDTKSEIELDENKILFNWVKDIYGKKCSEFEKDCACCIAWELYDRLVQNKDILQNINAHEGEKG